MQNLFKISLQQNLLHFIRKLISGDSSSLKIKFNYSYLDNYDHDNTFLEKIDPQLNTNMIYFKGNLLDDFSFKIAFPKLERYDFYKNDYEKKEKVIEFDTLENICYNDDMTKWPDIFEDILKSDVKLLRPRKTISFNGPNIVQEDMLRQKTFSMGMDKNDLIKDDFEEINDRSPFNFLNNFKNRGTKKKEDRKKASYRTERLLKPIKIIEED